MMEIHPFHEHDCPDDVYCGQFVYTKISGAKTFYDVYTIQEHDGQFTVTLRYGSEYDADTYSETHKGMVWVDVMNCTDNMPWKIAISLALSYIGHTIVTE